MASQTAAPFTPRRIKKQLYMSPVSASKTISTPSRTPSKRICQYETNKEPLEVFLRIRPIHPNQLFLPTTPTINSDSSLFFDEHRSNSTLTYFHGNHNIDFSFTRVFGPATTQATIYEQIAFPVLHSFLKDGKNGLIFAYGNTNAGKTHTITGTPQDPGLLPRILDAVYKFASAAANNEATGLGIEYDPNMRYAIWLSYLEIYNENIFDLLVDPSPSDASGTFNEGSNTREVLRICEDRTGEVFVKGLKEVLASTPAEALDLLRKGQRNRQVAETLMNADSSRSHSVFTIKLVAVRRGAGRDELKADPQAVQYRRLSIVDLAGSERANKTHNTGTRLKEAANINTSLLTFGRCLEALRWNQQHPSLNPKVVPFRESKLTRLFQEYFVGGSKAVMIVNVSPSVTVSEETLHVLKFSALAKQVSTATVVVASSAATAAAAAAEVGARKQASNATRLLSTNDLPDVFESTVVEDEEEQEDIHGNGHDVDTTVAELAETEATMAELAREIEDTRQRLIDAERRCAAIEAEVRDEVSREFLTRLQEMEQRHHERQQQLLAELEARYEKRFELANRVRGTEHEQLRREHAALRATYEQMAAEIALRRHADAAATASSPTTRVAVDTGYIDGLKLALQSLEAEKAQLLARISALEAAEVDMAAQVDGLRTRLAAEQAENERLRQRIGELEQRAASNPVRDVKYVNIASSSPVVMVRPVPPNGERVLHAERGEESPSTAHNIVLPEKSKLVTTPTKHDLMTKAGKPKFTKFELKETTARPAGDAAHSSVVSTLWKGDVKPSPSGKGVSVAFTEVEVLEHKPIEAVTSPTAAPPPAGAVSSPRSPFLGQPGGFRAHIPTGIPATHSDEAADPQPLDADDNTIAVDVDATEPHTPSVVGKLVVPRLVITPPHNGEPASPKSPRGTETDVLPLATAVMPLSKEELKRREKEAKRLAREQAKQAKQAKEQAKKEAKKERKRKEREHEEHEPRDRKKQKTEQDKLSKDDKPARTNEETAESEEQSKNSPSIWCKIGALFARSLSHPSSTATGSLSTTTTAQPAANDDEFERSESEQTESRSSVLESVGSGPSSASSTSTPPAKAATRTSLRRQATTAAALKRTAARTRKSSELDAEAKENVDSDESSTSPPATKKTTSLRRPLKRKRVSALQSIENTATPPPPAKTKTAAKAAAAEHPARTPMAKRLRSATRKINPSTYGF